MKKATLMVMTLLLLVGTGLAQSNNTAKTIDLVPTDSGLAVQLGAQATKRAIETPRSTTEVFSVQVFAPGMVDAESIEKNEEYFIGLEVQIDTTTGRSNVLVGTVQVSSFTGFGNLILMSRASFNSDIRGDLPLPVSQIKTVKLVHSGDTMAVGSY